MKRPGFTLVELLVVITILAVLLGIGFPLGRSLLARSREASCLNNLRSLGVGLQGYLQDHNNTMPVLMTGRSSKSADEPVLETTLLPYLGSEDAFRCPADSKEFAKSGSSYLWNSTQNGLPTGDLSFFGIKDRPDKIPLITDKEAWHPGGTNFLYADLTSPNKPRFAVGN